MISLQKNKILDLLNTRAFLYAYIVIFFIGIIVLSYTSFFLYRNFYQAITQSEELIFLKKEVAAEDIDIKVFDQIVEKMKKKTGERDVDVSISF